MQQYISHSASETEGLGRSFADQLLPNAVVCFLGDLGAGKTTFIRGLARGILGSAQADVSSPTYTYLNIYQGKQTLYHFDLYRLSDADEFFAMGFDEMFEAGGICCVEWAEKLYPFEIEGAYYVEMGHLGEDARSITIRQHSLPPK